MANQIYYVRPDSTAGGTGLSPVATGTSRAFVTLGAAITAAALQIPSSTNKGAGHVIYVAPGDYSEYCAITNANCAGMSVIGCTSTAFDPSPAARDTVVNRGTGATHAFYVGVNNVTIRNLTAWGNGAGKLAIYGNATAGLTLDTMRVLWVAGDAPLLQLAACTDFRINKSLLEAGGNADALYLLTTSTGIVSDTIIRVNRDLPLATQNYGTGISATGSGVVGVYGCIVSDQSYSGITIGGAVNATLKNNIIFSPHINHSAYGIAKSGTGTLTESNNVIIDNIWNVGNRSITEGVADASTFFPQAATIAKQNCNIAPTSYGKCGYIFVDCDDSLQADGTKLQYLKDLAVLMKPYGFSGTYYQYTNMPIDQYDELRTILTDPAMAGAWEIGCHTHSHSSVVGTTVGTITKSGGGTNPQYCVNMTASVIGSCPAYSIAVKTDEGTHNASYSFGSLEGLATIGQAIASFGNGWAITYSVPAPLNPMTDLLRLTSLAGTTNFTAITTAILLDAGTNADCSNPLTVNRFYRDEILYAKSMLDNIINGAGPITDPQTGQTYSCKSMATPYGVMDTFLALAIRSSGFTSSRYITTEAQDLRSYNPQKISHFAPTNGATVAETQAKTRNVCAQLAEHGMCYAMVSHNEAQCSTVNPEGWKAIFSTIAEFGDSIRVVSKQQFIVEVMASPWTWTPDVTYPTTGTTTRVYGNVSHSNFRPTAASVTIGAGAEIAGIHDQATPATDADGAIVHFTPNIGAYDGRKSLTVTANYSPTAYAVRGTDAEPAEIVVGANDIVIDLDGLTNDEAIIVKLRNKTARVKTAKVKHKVKAQGSGGGGMGLGL